MAEMITSQQLAKELQVSARTVVRWVQNGMITPALTLPSGAHRFVLADVQRQLREQRQRDQ